MTPNIAASFYLISGVLFILALRGLASPETSRKGNFFGILGMILEIAVTFFSVDNFFIRSMKTRWGSCTPKSRRVRFNLELAKTSPEILEYIVVHELIHLLEASHNKKFKALMDKFYPNWKYFRKELNKMNLRT